MTSIVYTCNKSKLSKKAKAAREALLKEQREVRRSLNSTFKPLSSKPTVYRREIPVIHSKSSGMSGVAAPVESKQYTGDAMIGIGQMHKSNAVPVFREDEAKDLASMRR